MVFGLPFFDYFYDISAKIRGAQAQEERESSKVLYSPAIP
jgi:hypothetical protein